MSSPSTRESGQADYPENPFKLIGKFLVYGVIAVLLILAAFVLIFFAAIIILSSFGQWWDENASNVTFIGNFLLFSLLSLGAVWAFRGLIRKELDKKEKERVYMLLNF